MRNMWLRSTGLGLMALLIVGGIARAAQDAVVNDRRVTRTITGDCGTVSINGEDCKVTVTGSCDTLNVRGRKDQVTIKGATDHLVVPGRRNRMTLEGGLGQCLIGGDENFVLVSGTDPGVKAHIVVTGDGNVVNWSKGPKGVAPDWEDDGRHNTLKVLP